MSSRFIDLTGDSSDASTENKTRHSSSKNSITMPRRQPLKAVKMGSTEAAKSLLSEALREAISKVDDKRLRNLVSFYCKSIEPLAKWLSEDLLVKGKDIVRYHFDTDDEDAVQTEDKDEEESDESSTSERVRKLKPISIADDEKTTRFAKCQNCHEEFDVTANDRGDCIWHPEQKEMNDDNDYWADHDVNCHGPYNAFIDDPDMAEGFTWTCCNRYGEDKGCKSTKHLAPVNQIVKPFVPVPPSKKRKAAKEIVRPLYARCENCNDRYDIKENGRKACSYHPGDKEVDYHSDMWCDHDERCHGRFESFINNPAYVDGFMWSCCESEMDAEGCEVDRHVPKGRGR